MTALSQLNEYGEAQALAAVFRQTQSPATGNVYLALLTATPTDNTGLTMAAVSEFSTSGTGYARQIFGPGAASAASPSVIGNNGTITFGPFTSAPGTTVCAAVCDAVSGTTANIIGLVILATSRTPLTGDSLVAAANAFTFSL